MLEIFRYCATLFMQNPKKVEGCVMRDVIALARLEVLKSKIFSTSGFIIANILLIILINKSINSIIFLHKNNCNFCNTLKKNKFLLVFLINDLTLREKIKKLSFFTFLKSLLLYQKIPPRLTISSTKQCYNSKPNQLLAFLNVPSSHLTRFYHHL